jgi:hypothetical protein
MKSLKTRLMLCIAMFLTACIQNTPATPTAATQPDATKNCVVSDATFTVDASDLKTMLQQAGLTVTSFSMTGTGDASTCTPAYSNALHFMQITLNAPDSEKATLGNELNTLVNIINNWITLTPNWTLSRLDKYNIYVTVTINPGGHQLSKTPGELLEFSNQGYTPETFWDVANK